MTTPTCETCRFWTSQSCRRYPPTAGDCYPQAYRDNWCGEWQAREQPCLEGQVRIISDISNARAKLLMLHPTNPPRCIVYLSDKARAHIPHSMVCKDGTEMLLGMRVRDCEAGWAVVREDA